MICISPILVVLALLSFYLNCPTFSCNEKGQSKRAAFSLIKRIGPVQAPFSIKERNVSPKPKEKCLPIKELEEKGLSLSDW